VSAVERLAAEVRDLERRVQALEERALEKPALESRTRETDSRAVEAAAVLQLPGWLSTGLVPLLGTAILGIGGAYLLRAIAESGMVPRAVAVAVAVVYAGLWLFRSGHQRPEREQAGVVYAATAGFIFLPMLWEATVRFKVLEPRLTAALLISFAVAAAALAWTRNRSALLWVTILPAAIAALVLVVTTGELTPFTIALLAIAAMVETAAVRDRWLGLRPVVALLADLGVWLMIYVGALPQTPGIYRPVTRAAAVALAFALPGIYAASMGCRTFLLRKNATLFETGQTALACILAVGGTLRLMEHHAPLGAFCLLGAAACYAVAFARLAAERSEARNHYAFGGYGLALLLTGSALLLPGPEAGLLWSGFAVAGMFAAARISSPRSSRALAAHAAICLVAAALVSGLFKYGWLAMTTTELPELAGLPPVLLWMQAAAVLCYAACFAARTSTWPRLVAASLAAYAMLAFSVTMVGPHTWAAPAAMSRLATARTVVMCAMALLAASAGGRWRRRELVWISYAMIALVTLKLIAEDFHQDSPTALAIALLSYGTVLVLAPRLTRSAPAGVHSTAEKRS